MGDIEKLEITNEEGSRVYFKLRDGEIKCRDCAYWNDGCIDDVTIKKKEEGVRVRAISTNFFLIRQRLRSGSDNSGCGIIEEIRKYKKAKR